ncbi:39S ribosomal protein L44, mitochondrial [Anthonomus grandis grandis]|uniref:39S ribosomal protein L44, mitochondrial n=1 Tax=Anthonomus grandis grandis TaxID=2921223 RepID=UPI00216568D6|nr:39S ribosomal protein L44, mitochondrial [Anthonomus grandis grandis]
MSLLRKSFCLGSRLLASSKAQHLLTDSRSIKRWVAPTIREINKRRKALGPEPVHRRSEHLEWNYDMEVKCFVKRLREPFDEKLLKEAFVQREWANLQEFQAKEKGDESFLPILHNHELAEDGQNLIYDHIKEVYSKSYPPDIVNAVCNYLTTDEMLGYIALHLGFKDLVKSVDYPPEPKTLADAFRATVGALSLSSKENRVPSFINDFVIAQMCDKEIYDIWTPEKPYDYLLKLLQERGINEVEPRLCNQSATNTILANYQVGLYNPSDKSCLGLGWGENIQIAKETAALDGIQRIYSSYVNK